MWLLAGLSSIGACGDDGGMDDPATSSPVVTLVEPNGGPVAGTQEISWVARDADQGDELTIDLELVHLDASGNEVEVTAIQSGVANVVGPEPTRVIWDREGVPILDDNGEPIVYRVRVTATDLAGNSASDDSDEDVTLLDDSIFENLVWDDIKPIFLEYCGNCHREPAFIQRIEFFRLDKYDASDPEAPTNGDQGVFEMKTAIQARLLMQGNMPPFGNPLPSQVEKNMIQAWFDDGLPRE
jgi:hypothetical protein